jgi:hypothetical protein
VSKATDRKWRRKQLRAALARRAEEEAGRERRLKGFKPANLGDMVTEINRRPVVRGHR